MRKFVLAAVLVLMASGAQASSYLDIFGTVHDPILTTSGVVHSYSANLQPNASLVQADLGRANLTGADLSGANLSLGYLDNANLTGANLSGANLNYVYAGGANLTGANLTGADLSFVEGLGTTTGIPYYDALTDFTGAWGEGGYGTQFDPVAAGWNLVPEPNTALLVGIGLAGIAARRRPATAR